MKNWVKKNMKTIVTMSFIIPIVIVAIVSISHVTQWYTLTNPVTWAIYLSIGVEVAALSALSAISVNMGKKVYLPFIVVTLLQLIGNVYFSYTFIDVNNVGFKNWVELTSPVVEFMGVEPTDLTSHKRLLSFFSGGMLPLISLSFLHMLVKFSEERKNEEESDKMLTRKVNVTPTMKYSDKIIPRGVMINDIIEDPEPLKIKTEDFEKLKQFLDPIDKGDDEPTDDMSPEDVPEKDELKPENMEGDNVDDTDNRFDKENKQRAYSKYTYGRK